MNAHCLTRFRRAATCIAVLAALGACHPVAAQSDCERKEAPRLFSDVMSSARIYPNADAALIGFALGSLWRPTDKCVHLAGELFARFGSRKNGDGADTKMRTAGGAIGALWGAGNEDRWFGAGAMFDLGWARVSSRDDFVLSGYLRALLYWRLRKQFWVGLDARAGHVIVPVTLDGIGISGPMVGLGIGAAWGHDDYGNR